MNTMAASDQITQKACFCCGDTMFREIYIKNTVYRICVTCLQKPHVKMFIDSR